MIIAGRDANGAMWTRQLAILFLRQATNYGK